MPWSAYLEGHALDFATLVRLFGFIGEPAVEIVDGACLVRSSDMGEDEKTVDEAGANCLIRRMNGLARALDSSFQPVALSNRHVSPTGTPTVLFSATATARSSAMVIISGSSPTPGEPASEVPGLLATAQREKDAEDVLLLLGSPTESLDWFILWKI